MTENVHITTPNCTLNVMSTLV